MNERSLATVILTILGLSYLYDSLSVLVTGAWTYSLLASSLHPDQGDFQLELFLTSVVTIQLVFGLILMIFARKISRVLFSGEEPISGDSSVSAASLVQAAVPILGIYLTLHSAPQFLSTSFHWFHEKAGPSSGMPPLYSEAMFQNTLLFLLSVILLLKHRSIGLWLTRRL
ncbi:MAG: hypothetical protein AAGC68_10810 [Verrucomicrobiota bacterium]